MDRGFGERVARRGVGRLGKDALELPRVFEVKRSEISVSGRRLELRNGRSGLVDAGCVHAPRLFQIDEGHKAAKLDHH